MNFRFFISSMASIAMITNVSAQVVSPPNSQIINSNQGPVYNSGQETFLRGNGTTGSARTLFSGIAMESPFQWIRVRVCNVLTTPQTIDSVTAQATREIFVNANAQFVVASSQVSSTLTGYAVNDTITFNAGGGTATTFPIATVTSVVAGVPQTWVFTTPGVFTVPPTGNLTSTATSGSGTGTLVITPTMKNGISWIPTDSSGATVLPVPVYFNEAAQAVTDGRDPTLIGIDPRIIDNPPGVQTGWTTAGQPTVAAVTIPASTSTAHPACILSDWTAVQSVPRQDGSFRPWLTLRAYISAASSTWAAGAFNWNDPSINKGRDVVTADGGGDLTLNTNPLPAVAYRQAIFGVISLGNQSGFSELECGDSITQGHSYTPGTYEIWSGYYSWGNVATAAASRAGRPVSHWQGGWTAQTTAQFYARCIEDVQRLRPNVVFIAPFSPNDNSGVVTQASINAGYAWALALAFKVKQLGGTPVLWTAIPPNGTASCAGDQARLTLNNLIRNSGLYYVDMDAIISDGQCPAHIAAKYDSGDALHPNKAGYDAMGLQGALPVLLQIIGQ